MIVLFSIFLLFLLKVFKVLGNIIHKKIRVSIIEAWYWRLFHIRFWIFLYALIIPILILHIIPLNMKLWILTIYGVFSILSYVYFINQCEIILREKWRCFLIKKKSLYLIRRSILIHTLLTIFPVIFYLFIK